MQNKNMITTLNEFYEGIEDLVTPELFFDLMGWQDSKHGEHPIKYRISTFHYLLCEKLTSVLGVSMYALSRGLISLGEIALAKTHGLCEGQVKTVEVDCAGSRKEHNVKLVKGALKGIEHVMGSKRAVTDLSHIALKYGRNKYAKLLPATLVEGTEIIPQAKIEISNELEINFKQITDGCLNDNMFKLKRDNEDRNRNTRISTTVVLINQVFSGKSKAKGYSA